MKHLLGTILTILLLAASVEAAAQTIQNASYQTVGYIKSDGAIGHIKSDGTVQDASYRTIGYAKDIPRKWAAFYFFFQK